VWVGGWMGGSQSDFILSASERDTHSRGISLSLSLWLSINNLAPRRARTEQSPCVHFSGAPVQSFELGDVAPCTETLATHSHAGCNQLIGLPRDVLQAPRAAHEMRNNKSRAASACTECVLISLPARACKYQQRVMHMCAQTPLR
jgi:hypothetical protein